MLSITRKIRRSSRWIDVLWMPWVATPGAFCNREGGDCVGIRFRMGTPIEVRRVLVRVSNMVANNEMGSKEANSIISACNAVLSAIKTDEQQKRLEELERKIKEYEENKNKRYWE